MTEVDEIPAAPAKPPWYTLDPRTLTRSRLAKVVLIALALVAFSVVPLWRLLWYFPVYGIENFVPVKDTQGHKHAAWQWIDGREIRVYAVPGVSDQSVQEIASGIRSMVTEAGLDFKVNVLPMPPKVAAAYRASLVPHVKYGRTVQYVSFERLASHLVELRQGDPHADAIIADAPMTECDWAFGMAMFSHGLAIFERDNIDFHLGKHETGHLLGYLYHDSVPLYVIGYPWEDWPWSRDTLMMLYGHSNEISPRTRDALHYFWRGLEKRSGKHYLK